MNMKKNAAEKAVEYIQDGMKVGLGTGSTAYWAIVRIGERVKEGLSIEAVATSKTSEKLAIEHGITLTPLHQIGRLDLTIDGADELDPELRLIKGGGGALLREKITAFHSDRLLIVADESKSVSSLGNFPLPVEIVPFAREWTYAALERLGCSVRLRLEEAGNLYVTDNGNYIADCEFGIINSPEQLEQELRGIPGVVEHGLFIGMADIAFIGRSDGSVDVMAITTKNNSG
ncbi:ribose-5-phosphate isomerase [Paenibacillus uliginis N3/975]|uniref:Ribose-5-phosphate isomerase A n=1 Tax=Paenibacillus uliginis N3/975 TaxID=1313296 RepID=A0A1X7H827_9BACL|nr:ribose-5-phosphate isomerase RpiA [Paenibacillus uliginis]SMF81167.1 ribose-5-phosphate isomerase [Paenibacillus uliginis N3/975]